MVFKREGRFGFVVFLVFLVFFMGLFFSVFIGSVAAENCWEHSEATESICEAETDYSCIWKSDSWGSWCEELNCWSLWTSSDCSSGSDSLDCIWKDSSTSNFGWCGQTTCFSYKNESTCSSTSDNLNCNWQQECYGWNSDVDCYSLSEGDCGEYSGCHWGECQEQGCWSYMTNESCSAVNGTNSRSCQWVSDAWGSWCREASCWDYGGSSSNQTYCENNELGMDCTWINNNNAYKSCEEPSCWHYDYTNSSNCESNSYGMNCTWDGQYCMMQGCWGHDTQSECGVASGCTWETSSGGASSGWCEEAQCWSFDSWNGGNQSICEIDALNNYSLSCAWGGASPTDGWCMVNLTTSCSSFTSEKDCMDTYYCWWQYIDWNDISQGGSCSDPLWGTGDYDSSGIFNDWNPGCYIFDMNSSDCNNVLGCNYTDSVCNTLMGHDNENGITIDGLNCSMINDSRLCSNIPALSTCCEWTNSSCQTKLGKSCWESVDKEQDELGITACEDVSMKASDESAQELCNQIAGSPLYMPCQWKNASKSCVFKSEKVFGNESAVLSKIDNKKNCQAAGGKWIKEWYCEGNRSVSSGRCEQKGDDEKNCDKSCFACEYKFDGTAHNSSQAAKSYCYSSKLGYCEFTEDTTAPNGFGFCGAKQEFKKGIASDCKTDCGSCTFTGNPNAATYASSTPATYDTCNTPECKCKNVKEFNNVTCKWDIDSSSSIGGYCLDRTDKTCSDSCNRCSTRTNCLEKGRSAVNATGSCEWVDSSGVISTDEDEGICQKAGQGEEICWDSIDNDGDSLIDCADSGCFSDSACGFVSGDCFLWNTQASCEINQLANGMNCSWINDSWGSWCDFPGADCWKYDGNATQCNAKNTTCDWNVGSGSGWCEQDWSVGDDCYALMTEAGCNGGSNCTWSNDTWCSTGDGAESDWCQTQGGWCNPAAFAPKNCWQNDNTDNATCAAITGCIWEDPWCMEVGCWNYDNNKTSCAAADGCGWEESDWQSCEMDWSYDCWKYNSSSTCSANSCTWRTDSWGSWCDHPLSVCWDRTSSTCEADSSCSWNANMWNWMTDTQGSCEPSCMSLSNDDCSSQTGCRWSEGWCMSNSVGGSSGGVNCWDYDSDSSACEESAGCRWKSPGWCNPKGFSGGEVSGGFGMGSEVGMDCWKYNGDEVTCTNSSLINITCSWMEETNPFCEPDWTTNCWQYASVEAGCNATNGCWFNNGYCSNAFDECWNNMTISNNETLCDINSNCNWSSNNNCQPSCSEATTEGACTGNCNWNDGWCNSPGKIAVFNNMEKGTPDLISADDCIGEISESYLDLCGVGVEDMGNDLGFGSEVADFSEAGLCNQEKLIGSQFGTGNKTIEYFVYLDTDGVRTGGCSLSHNSSAVGYDLFLKYSAVWNATLGKVKKTSEFKKCGANGWAFGEGKLNVWEPIMCSEINGPMIAINKDSIWSASTLSDSQQDLRVFVAIAGENTNASYPSDSAGPGWFTPGSLGFKMDSFQKLGVDSAKFEDILKKGYVEYEDCYNAIDDDDDDLVDCADWDCEFLPKCASTGVNAVGYVDSSMPKITGIRVEEYTDSALVMYSTNKPTNGSLIFWHNDSTCSLTPYNRTINDATSLVSVRNYTLWHDANVYNGSGNLDYALVNGTTYYYKLKVCDSGSKCSVSACTSLKTAISASKCSYCKFVTKIEALSGWNVSYDLDTNGVYEHNQGLVCGPRAGMKTNYTSGRKANIKLSESDGSVYFEFINVTLTKTGLTSDTRDIDAAGDLIHDSSEGFVGMPADTRDKIINNLHPEICKIKIPAAADGSCSRLYHCDDSGNNCEDRTSESTLLDSTNCVWQLPYCEFSTWDSDNNPSAASPDGSGGGGGGGGGGATVNNSEDSEDEGDSDEPSITGDVVDGEDSDEAGIADKINELAKKDLGGLILMIIVIVGVLVVGFIEIRRFVIAKKIKSTSKRILVKPDAFEKPKKNSKTGSKSKKKTK
jgi:hypothetical protein